MIANPNILICDNVSADLIIENIKDSSSEDEEAHINTSLLNTIRAYDEKPRDEIKDLMVFTAEFLLDRNPSELNRLNHYQVKYRLKTLYEKDIADIEEILKNSDELQNKVGASILLDKAKEAKKLLDQMELKEREAFETYPIYKLLQGVANNN